MPLEEQLITASLTDTFHEANKVLDQLYKIGPRSVAEAEGPSEELEQTEYFLTYYVEKAFRDTCILAERLGLPLLRKEIAEARDKIKNLKHTELYPDDQSFHSPPLQIARDYFASLQAMMQGRGITGLGIFENILKSAGKIVAAQKLVPTNETQVSNALREVLSFAFPGDVRTDSIEKTLKSYKPDIGVVTLMAAAEVKFCTTHTEAKAALDGIYADMKGYSGRDEWRSFYAIIYMTEAFYSQEDVEKEFRLVKAEYSWTPLVVLGPGERKKAAK